MGVETVLAISAVAAAAFGGATAYESARKSNSNVKRAKLAADNAASAKQKQLAAQAAFERQKRTLEAEKIHGRALVAASESGFEADSGNFEALLRQNDLDLGLNLGAINTNLANNRDNVASGNLADQIGFDSQRQNALLSSLNAGLSGAGAGLQIGGAINSSGTYTPNGTEEDFFHEPGGR